MKKLIYYFLPIAVILPQMLAAQGNLVGIWSLTEKQDLKGATYGNGLPKLLRITEEAGKITLALTTSIGDKDTMEVESFEKSKDNSLVSITPKGRQKKVQLLFGEKGLWVRQMSLSAKDDVTRQEISALDSLRLSTDGNQLILTRHYDGLGTTESNQDYIMAGNYKKISADQMARETAIGKGVQWIVGFTWPQVLEKARQEKKLIFVDCYATWCGPCKTMDREVFPLNWVGETMKKDFLAIKVQMDTGKNDPENIQLTYPIARQLDQKYKIDAFPSYLFFDGTGRLVHKEVGTFNTKEFVNILHKAANPNSQLYTRYELAKSGKWSSDSTIALASQLFPIDREKSRILVRVYIDKELYSLGDQELLAKENLEKLLPHWWVVKSQDRIFKLFHRNPEKINQILGKKKEEEFAKQLIEDIVSLEEINPVIKHADSLNKTPDWKMIASNIVRKFGKQYVSSPILNTQVWWYKKQKQWEQYSDYLCLQVEGNKKRTPDDWNYFNSAGWKMCLYSIKKTQLETALQWVQLSVDQQVAQKVDNAPMVPTCDTYGNLLYKLGRREEAIAYYQKMVIDRLPKDIKQQVWVNTLNRMKQGLPTWKDREKWATN